MPEQARHISNILQDVCCYQRVDLRQLHLHEELIKLVRAIFDKRTEIERFDWFIERTDKRVWLFIG